MKGVTEIPTNDAMPSGAMPLIELLLYLLRNILLHIVPLERLIREKVKPL